MQIINKLLISMKNSFILLIACMLSVLSTIGQTSRLLLVEEFTNASCGPCASQNPTFDALMQQNVDKCVCIKYHTSWPGVDPMYTHNKTEATARVSYYGVSGVPTAFLDAKMQIDPQGVYYDGAPHNFSQQLIDDAQAQPSPISLKVHQDLSAGSDSIIITIAAKILQDISGPLTLHCAVVEKEIKFIEAPGANGEKEFYDVMKKMLPSATGTTLKTSYVAGENIIQRFVWKLENVYKVSELGVVAFIQNKSTKEVLQAARNSNEPLSEFNKDGIVYNAGNMLSAYCAPTAQPTFEFLNMGNDTLKSAVFHYRINNDPVKEYKWTGTLPFLASAKFSLPVTDFTLEEKNKLVIYTSEIDEMTDQNPSNDTTSFSFGAAPVVAGDVTVFIKTDTKPSEITWDITDKEGNILANEGPYSTPSKVFKSVITPEAGKCYIFNVYDAGGDGVCCNTGNGFVNLTYSNGASTLYLLQGTSFGKNLQCQFYSASGVGIGKPDAALFYVYPNPTSKEVNIHFENAVNELVTTEVVNSSGKKVLAQPATHYNNGTHQISLDCQRLPAGIYTVRLTAGSKSFSKKIVISR